MERKTMMTLSEIIQDIHACEEDLLMYERKYGILTPTFYESFMQGDEPPNDAWVLDWNGWAATYEVWLRRREQYEMLIQTIRKQTPLITVIEKAAYREPIPVPA
jgi:hypothetical protein